MTPPLINGVNYTWGDVTVSIPGIAPILIGITAIDYSEMQDIEANYGANNFPIGAGPGQFKYKGSIELYREVINQIIAIAPNGKIQLIPFFTVKIVYGNTSQALTVDTLVNCLFKDNNFATKAGDKKMVNKLELFIGNIGWNGN